jgi:hypothetical protein
VVELACCLCLPALNCNGPTGSQAATKSPLKPFVAFRASPSPSNSRFFVSFVSLCKTRVHQCWPLRLGVRGSTHLATPHTPKKPFVDLQPLTQAQSGIFRLSRPIFPTPLSLPKIATPSASTTFRQTLFRRPPRVFMREQFFLRGSVRYERAASQYQPPPAQSPVTRKIRPSIRESTNPSGSPLATGHANH